MDDPIDVIREQLKELYPDLDTNGLAVTGRILRLGAVVEGVRNRFLKEYGLTQADFDVLATLRRLCGDRGCNPTELHRSVMITSGGMTKRLDRLEQAALVTRRPDPDDRRGTLIELTTKGFELIDEVLPGLLASETELVLDAVTGKGDVERLQSLLSELLVAYEGSKELSD